jgi:hypothetical protein
MRQASFDHSSPLARESIPKTAFPCPLGFSFSVPAFRKQDLRATQIAPAARIVKTPPSRFGTLRHHDSKYPSNIGRHCRSDDHFVRD